MRRRYNRTFLCIIMVDVMGIWLIRLDFFHRFIVQNFELFIVSRFSAYGKRCVIKGFLNVWIEFFGNVKNITIENRGVYFFFMLFRIDVLWLKNTYFFVILVNFSTNTTKIISCSWFRNILVHNINKLLKNLSRPYILSFFVNVIISSSLHAHHSMSKFHIILPFKNSK